MKFEIKNKFIGNVQFECELSADIEKQEYRFQLGFAIKSAYLTGADLTGADLTGADLTGADLTGAYLKGAYLKGADLTDADLTGAYLKGADLTGAYLTGADLTGADLKGAYLKGAYLTGADLTGADLTGAYLTGAYLEGADLKDIKIDFFKRLELAKNEILGLYDALMRGKINGSAYTGDCACFCGTIANIRGENYQTMTNNLNPDSLSATEKWFLAISTGDIPQNNQVSHITAGWIREFMDKESIKYPRYEIVALED